jgi:hypothetical protein
MNSDTKVRQQAQMGGLTKINIQGTELEGVIAIHLAQDRYQ